MVCLLHMMHGTCLFFDSAHRELSIRPWITRGWTQVAVCGIALLALHLGLPAPALAEKAPEEPSDEFDPGETQPPPDHAGVQLSGMTFVSSQNGVSEVIVRAAEAYIDPEKNVVFLRGMDVTTTSSAEGEVEFKMRCDEGELDLASNDFIARGNVQGRTIDGRRFRTEWARYEEDRALVSTDAPVVLKEDGGTLRGGGFEYWVAEGRLLLTGGATMIQGEVE